MSLLARLLAGAGLLLITTAPAGAHSLLLEAAPPADSVGPAPRSIDLRFNNRIERRFCRLRLVDDHGRALSLTVEDGGAGDRLRAAAPPLPPGRYRVEWQVLSVDGHVVSGTFPFRVAP